MPRILATSRFPALVLLLCLAAQSSAHHAFEVYYDIRDGAATTMSGTVKKLTLHSPHSYLVVTVDSGDATTDWVLEAPAGMYLTRSGWPLDRFESGATVAFTGFPARNGDPAMRVQTLEMEGREYCAFACSDGSDAMGMPR